ncbi:hypothetical protein NC99_28330 [Sunxiuqinia dokdonensis]|uniref:Uncharacterized protein n=1 Tax=Sunxiuqinia dokdonensis TaxID=1409788 RepID=A0A0L8V7G4_9BACT|nr:hypothetical protein NC99_28330 [Sunxiuqinia dokdonensis]
MFSHDSFYKKFILIKSLDDTIYFEFWFSGSKEDCTFKIQKRAGC